MTGRRRATVAGSPGQAGLLERLMRQESGRNTYTTGRGSRGGAADTCAAVAPVVRSSGEHQFVADDDHVLKVQLGPPTRTPTPAVDA
jgi:hypothetical protein